MATEDRRIRSVTHEIARLEMLFALVFTVAFTFTFTFAMALAFAYLRLDLRLRLHPRSYFRIPHFAFRISHSAFRHFAFRIPHTHLRHYLRLALSFRRDYTRI